MKEIKLTQGKVALVDDEDFEKLNQLKWFAVKANNTYYAKRAGNIRMHRIIMGVDGGKIIDHISGNGLDNRKENLRICSNDENIRNRRSAKNSYSKWLGVSFEPKRNKWSTRITNNKNKVFVGYFNSEENAAIAYNIFAEKLHGEFANLNKS